MCRTVTVPNTSGRVHSDHHRHLVSLIETVPRAASAERAASIRAASIRFRCSVLGFGKVRSVSIFRKLYEI